MWPQFRLRSEQRGIVFFSRLAQYKYLPTYFSQKIQFFFLSGKKKTYTYFFFWIGLSSWRIKYLKSLCLALTSSLCSEPFLLLKILLPTTCFQDVFELFFRFPHKFPGRTLNFLFASIYIIKLKVQREGNCTVKKNGRLSSVNTVNWC